MTKLDDDIEQLVEAISLLSDDVEIAASLPESQFAKRTWIRAVFALLECNTNLMADAIVKAAQRGDMSISPQEIAVLREETYRIAPNGSGVQTQASFSPLRSRFRFVIELLAKLYMIDFKLDVKAHGWTLFLDAVKVRNRITHPSATLDFEISEEDVDKVSKAKQWYVDQMDHFLNKVPDDA